MPRAGQGCSEAEVGTVAEGEMLPVLPQEIELPRRAAVQGGVATGYPKGGQDGLALADQDPVREGDVLDGVPHGRCTAGEAYRSVSSITSSHDAFSVRTWVNWSG